MEEENNQSRRHSRPFCAPPSIGGPIRGEPSGLCGMHLILCYLHPTRSPYDRILRTTVYSKSGAEYNVCHHVRVMQIP